MSKQDIWSTGLVTMQQIYPLDRPKGRSEEGRRKEERTQGKSQHVHFKGSMKHEILISISGSAFWERNKRTGVA